MKQNEYSTARPDAGATEIKEFRANNMFCHNEARLFKSIQVMCESVKQYYSDTRNFLLDPVETILRINIHTAIEGKSLCSWKQT